jgi:tRNA(Ile)-lysidine synthase
VVAVSGGADSVALLRALVAARPGPLTVAHFDHRLRGSESDADAAFVRELAGQLGLGFQLGSADVAQVAVEASANLEATARRLRYEWLAQVAAEVGANWVATGHTADDQAETVLHRLIRGTGLPGLRGIAAVKTNPTIIRPLLAITRAEVEDYLRSLGQQHRTDSSNGDLRFTRNRIRAELLPLLKTFNPEIVAALGRVAEQATGAHDLVVYESRTWLARAEHPRSGATVILDAASLVTGPRLVVRTALRLVWEREGWPLGGMGYDHWDRLIEIADREAGGWDFPGGVSARRRGRVVQLGRGL